MRRIKPRTIAAQSGFSMLEVLGGVTLFAIVAGGLAASTIAVIKANQTARDLAAASALVQDRLEQYRAATPAQIRALLSSSETEHSYTDPNNPLTALGTAGTNDSPGRFTRTWVVSRASWGGPVSRIEVTVSWTTPSGTNEVSSDGYYCSVDDCG